MTNPFNRGTAPGRARDASERPGTFKPGHKKVGGRKKGTPNALSADYKNAIIAAAYFAGRDGMGAGGLIGYCQRLLIEAPDVALMLLARMFIYDDVDWPPDDRILGKEQNNKEVRELIGANKTDSGSPDPALTTQFPIPELMRIAVKHPKIFGKIFAPLVPVPRGRPRRPQGMTPTSVEEQHSAWLQFQRACALLYGQTRLPPVPVVEPRGDAAFPTRVESPYPDDELTNESRHQRSGCAVEYGWKIS